MSPSVYTLAVVIDTSTTRRGEREPRHVQSTYYLKRRSATFDSVGIRVPSQGQYKSSRAKHGKWKPAPLPLPSSGAPRQRSDLILAHFRRQRGGGMFLAGWGDNAAGLRVYLSIQAFRVNLPSSWRLCFLHPEKNLPPQSLSSKGFGV